MRCDHETLSFRGLLCPMPTRRVLDHYGSERRTALLVNYAAGSRNGQKSVPPGFDVNQKDSGFDHVVFPRRVLVFPWGEKILLRFCLHPIRQETFDGFDRLVCRLPHPRPG